jgi:hypothetical protein
MGTKLDRIEKMSAGNPKMVFTSRGTLLLHRLT